MDLTIAKKDFLRAVASMQGVAEKKSTMPVLSNILLGTDGNKLRVSATDLYLSMECSVAADVSRPGRMALPAHDLLERIKMMPEGSVRLSEDGENALLRASGSQRRYKLRAIPGGDFPPLPKPAEGATTATIDAELLSELIVKTQFSICGDETRVHLNSALLEWDVEVVRMVTTDGHRLTKIEREFKAGSADKMLLPLKAIVELRKLCEDAKTIVITHSGSSAFFTSGDATFGARLTDAEFPPYHQVIPKTTAKTLRAFRAPLADAFRAVSLASSEKTGGVKVSPIGNVVHITSESSEGGEGVDEVPIEYSGPACVVGVNASYMLDVLDALREDSVDIGISGELDPVVIRPVSKNGGDFIGVVMPLRL